MKITDAQLAKGYEQAKATLKTRCLCGAAYSGDWTAGIHHQEHCCARVITRMGAALKKIAKLAEGGPSDLDCFIAKTARKALSE